MSATTVTKTGIRQGAWRGIVSHADSTPPTLSVTHLGKPIEGVEMQATEAAGQWTLQFPIPAEAISDGVQTLLIVDATTGETLAHVTLIMGEVLGEDIRAETDLLRAELDMLKRAFRRHCVETA